MGLDRRIIRGHWRLRRRLGKAVGCRQWRLGGLGWEQRHDGDGNHAGDDHIYDSEDNGRRDAVGRLRPA
jgi:hypothetical protein